MERFDLEYFPTSESAQRMIRYVTEGFYEKSYVGKWMYQVMGLEYDKVLEILESLPEQFFPETATWGLMYHEIKWGLPVRMNLPYEERRRIIYEKRDMRIPMTPYNMERYLENVTGARVQVTDIHDLGRYSAGVSHPNMFHVSVIGDSGLKLEDIRKHIDSKKQAHTAYTIELLGNCYDVGLCAYWAMVLQTKKIYDVEVV